MMSENHQKRINSVEKTLQIIGRKDFIGAYGHVENPCIHATKLRTNANKEMLKQNGQGLGSNKWKG